MSTKNVSNSRFNLCLLSYKKYVFTILYFEIRKWVPLDLNWAVNVIWLNKKDWSVENKKFATVIYFGNCGFVPALYNEHKTFWEWERGREGILHFTRLTRAWLGLPTSRRSRLVWPQFDYQSNQNHHFSRKFILAKWIWMKSLSTIKFQSLHLLT